MAARPAGAFSHRSGGYTRDALQQLRAVEKRSDAIMDYRVHCWLGLGLVHIPMVHYCQQDPTKQLEVLGRIRPGSQSRFRKGSMPVTSLLTSCIAISSMTNLD